MKKKALRKQGGLFNLSTTGVIMVLVKVFTLKNTSGKGGNVTFNLAKMQSYEPTEEGGTRVVLEGGEYFDLYYSEAKFESKLWGLRELPGNAIQVIDFTGTTPTKE